MIMETLVDSLTDLEIAEEEIQLVPITPIGYAPVPIVTVSTACSRTTSRPAASLEHELDEGGESAAATRTRDDGEPKVIIPRTRVPGVIRSIKSIVTLSWLNDKHFLVFACSFLAIVPLPKLLDFGREELTMRLGQTIPRLLNLTLGNAIDLIVLITALLKCQLGVVQSSLIGSILNHLLLVLGLAFFTGGLKFSDERFTNGVSTQINSSLLTLAVISFLIPAAFRFTVTTASDPDSGNDILKFSHAVALILVLVYACFLHFELRSHASLYRATASPECASSGKEAAGSASCTDLECGVKVEVEAKEAPRLNFYVAFALVVTITVIAALTVDHLVDSIDGLTSSGHIPKGFVGFILLPVVGNGAEYVVTTSDSVNNRLNVCLGDIVESRIQVALVVAPFLVTLAWILGKPLSMLFDPVQSIGLLFTVVLVNLTIKRGKAYWLDGALLILVCYFIFAVVFFFYPGTSEELMSILPLCT
ncbi:Calcium/proton exchanger [Mycena polygramma]|nr:Calcium/proton exchanger [Mycena polygramma]